MLEFKSKLEQTRKKLLDLTKRNKLINYKKPAKTRHLKIIDESPEFIYRHLVFDESPFKFKFIPEPEIQLLEHKKLEAKKEKIEKLQQSTLFAEEKKAAEHQIQKIFEELQSQEADALLTAEEQAKRLGFDISSELPEIDLTNSVIDEKYTDDYLQTLHYPSDLEKILKKIDLSARSILEETGTNMLYVILGVLEWTESDNSEVKLKSPLINIPVTLTRGSINKKTNTYEYKLEYNGESIDTNKSLAEKLKNDFNIILPELTEELSFNEYLLEVKKICNNKKKWTIKQEISLDFLQFSKILMYKDLDTEVWDDSLDKNKVLNELFLGKEVSSVSYAPEAYNIDDDLVANNIPLVLDADSSQHSAIVDVLNGKNVVIEGPPGTGKSQTISNMIASLIAEGKSVLFVSEKLAALEVVYKRLSNIGLGDFCLELHSHKTQKLKVLDSLKQRLDGCYKTPDELDRVKKELESKKRELKEYIDTLHLEHGNTEKKIFEIFWLVEKYQKVATYLRFDIDEPESYEIMGINNKVEELNKYQSYVKSYDFQSFYWNGFELEKLEFIDIDIFISKLNNLNHIYKKISNLYENIKALSVSNNIAYDIENEITENKNINLFLTQNEKYLTNHMNQSLLDNLNSDNIITFEKYIETYENYIDIKNKCQENIIDIDKLNNDEIEFLIKLDKVILTEIEERYLKPKKESKKLYTQLDNCIDTNKYNLENNNENELVDKLLSIKDFLYEDISLSSIENIYSLNANFTDSLSRFEKILKELIRLIGISKTYDIYNIETIIRGLNLINQIDQMHYVNCTNDIGTSKYISLIEKAKIRENEIVNLIEEIENYFILDKINSKKIEELKNIKDILADKKDSFFKIFSGVFKKSKNEYSELLKDPLSNDSNIWIKQLNKAIDYVRLKEEYETNNEFQTTFKDLFNGLDTNWEKINNLNNWAERVRKDIKINDYMRILLSGNEQVHITLSSYTTEFSESIENFNTFIEQIEKTYQKHFIKKIYHHIDDIDIVALKYKLEDINEKIDNYLPMINEFIMNKDTDINQISELIKNHSLIEKSHNAGLEFVNKLMSDRMVGNIDIDVNKFIDKSLFILNNQKLPMLDVINMIQSEIDLKNRLNKLIEHIKFDLNYELKQTNDEIKLIKYHIDFISKIRSSYLSESIKNLFIKQYYLTVNLLQNISKEYNSSISLSNEIAEFGELKSIIFYGAKLNHYSVFIDKLDELNENIDNLSIWIDYKKLLLRIKKLGLISIINSIENETLPKEFIIEAYYYNFYNSLLKSAFRKHPLLNRFSRLSHEEVINTFKALDLKLLELNKEYVASKSSEKEMPYSYGGGSVRDFTNLRLIEHEISKKKRHIPIRQLIKRAGEAIQALKPCFMMSPLSVAQYLPPKELKFDVLLVDEASQLRPEEALGVIARSNQIVIVGDPKQLPPTSFFDTMKDDTDNEDYTIVDEAESILDTCIDLFSPIRRLKWHYRSQHETLISFSNQQFYDNDLIVFPSPSSVHSSELGVKHTYIENAIYQGGASQRYNKVEAKVVVEHIAKQMKDFPNKTLGIGTFNTSQRDLIQQMIDEKEKSNPHVANFILKWKDSAEPFFIKNLESLQGDERDVIFISTTYGPDKTTGQVMQRFGPINQDSGWRRLNVLITRSKQKMHIFTSMKSENIKISESSSKGVIALRGFLQFLETGQLTMRPEITDKGFDSPFEESVYQLLGDAGIKSVPQVGVAGYFIDLAVVAKEDSDFILAIECDGATYHSSKSARDRDRLKDEVLKKLGWTVYRIWSVDWYKNRQNEVSKLLKVIAEEQAKYSEKYKYRKPITPIEQDVIVENIYNSVESDNDINKKIEENYEQHQHTDIELNKSEYTQSFLSDEKVKELLTELREKEISKEFTIDKRCILSPMMIDQFVKHKPLDMDDFRDKIALKLRTSIDREQLVYMDNIFEILEMADE